jgi:hypothetical protein
LLRSLHRGHPLWAMTRPFRHQAQNRLPAESRRIRIPDGILLEHHNKFVVDDLFREVLESQKNDNTILLHLVHSDDLKYDYIFRRFSTFSFIDCEDSTHWGISDAPIAKADWRFHRQMLMNSWDIFDLL